MGVRHAVQSKHANYVVQKIVEIMPMKQAAFVAEELTGFGQEASKHAFGCRVICRILEHYSPSDCATSALLEDIAGRNLSEMCSHSYGSYVVRHILDFAGPEHKRLVAQALLPDVAGHSSHRLGSHVVEAALRCCLPMIS